VERRIKANQTRTIRTSSKFRKGKRRTVKKIFFMLLVIIALTSLPLSGCSDNTQTTTPTATTSAPSATTTAPTTKTTAPTATTTAPDAAKYGGVYIQALTVAPARPIGYLSEGANDSGTAASPAVESLVTVDTKGVVHPKLAVSWKVADDKKGLIIELRKGVKFHDGSVFNAEVAKWNLDLMIKAKVGSSTDWTSVDVIDEYTIRINVPEYKNTLLTGLAGRVTQMTSKEFVDKNGIEAARWKPIGTGPFIFSSYERDAKLTYKRNPS
jgi:peptide/nickel transport system substrate-binding protein